MRLDVCGFSRYMVDDNEDWMELVRGARLREPGACESLVERLYPRVAGRIRGLLPRREEVDDLAQEVFLRIFSRLAQYRGGSFPAWVDSIARRVCYDALRRQRVRPEWRFADFSEDPPESSSGVSTQDVDAAMVLSRLFDQILPEQAWLLREVELEQRPIGEVSRDMGWTPGGGRLRLLRARRALKRAYESWNEVT